MKKFIVMLTATLIVVSSAWAQSGGRIFGTYIYDSTFHFTFSGNTFTGVWGGAPVSGTFTVTGNVLTVNATRGNLSPGSPRLERFTISPDFRTIRDSFGDVWHFR